MTSYIYDQNYHEYAARISMRSAQIITQMLKSILSIESVLDVGCARGTWLSVWQDIGVTSFMGIDGDYIDTQKLLIEQKKFESRDLCQPFTLERTFDLVQCLEVAEHLPESRAKGLISDLIAHSNIIFFSAAPPGQGGENHLNEQPYSYWRDLFNEHEFAMIDCIRPAIHHMTDISPWYRYNSFLFIHREKLAQLSPMMAWFEIKKDDSIADISPWGYQLRKALIRQLPFFIRQQLAKFQARVNS